MKKHPWYHYYVLAAISKIWRWSPARRAVLNAASVGVNGKRCSKCKEVIQGTTKVTKRGKKRKYSGVEVDHKIPVVAIETGLTTWDEYIKRKLAADINDLQVLCVKCHSEKSTSENATRRKKAA